MLKLILMRHAKSSWDHPDLSDHKRPLNARGARAAISLGDWLKSNEHCPDIALVSDARRTQETVSGLGLSCPVELNARLYHATASSMLEDLRQAQQNSVLMIGHNPGIADLANRLLTAPPDHPDFFRFPTGATLVAEVPVETWAALDWHSGQAISFVTPRGLQAAGSAN